MDEWVKAAIADESLVAEQVTNLRHSASSLRLAPWVKWNVRKSRYSVPLSRAAGSNSQSGAAPAPSPVINHCTEKMSKANATDEATTSKSLQEKKSISEQEEEELFERKYENELKRTVACLIGNLKKRQSENTGLKRMKMDVASEKPNTDMKLAAHVAFVKPSGEGP